jgi:hypothetical protein
MCSISSARTSPESPIPFDAAYFFALFCNGRGSDIPAALAFWFSAIGLLIWEHDYYELLSLNKKNNGVNAPYINN